jgi:hypothetical protein
MSNTVVANNMSPAWRNFDCLNMANRLFVVIPEGCWLLVGAGLAVGAP